MSELAIIIIVFLTFLCLYSWSQLLKPMPEFKYRTRDIVGKFNASNVELLKTEDI